MKIIELGNRGKNINFTKFTIVDDADYERLNQYKWHDRGRNTVSTKIKIGDKWTHVVMHRAVIGNVPPGYTVDHINQKRLDNRRSNLRLATQEQNNWNVGKRKTNTTGYLGVSRSPWNGNLYYRASVKEGGKRVFDFISKDPLECAYVYDQVVMQIRGEYARTNMEYEV